jgi:serine/threonine protein kinase
VDSGTLLSGRYRLDRPIDSGAMGAVWAALDERLKREVAVKILLPGLDGAGERFQREAETLASLKGPNYVEVYDFGEELDGDREVKFLVMELVEGTSLARLLAREDHLDPERTMRIIAEAADALGAAHRRQIVHRDVKPANLLIDADDRVRLVDFGISLLVDQSRLTDSKEVLGTIPYVSPERLRNQDVTGKSDLYSLGAVAYECLTGTPPFPGRDAMAVIHSHLYEEPPPLPDTIPPQVASVVSRLLRKEPEERWESGEALAEACRMATTGEIVVPPPPPQPPVEDRPDRRKRLALLVIATVLAAAVLGVVAWSPWTGDGPLDPGAGTESSADDGQEAAADPTATATTESPSAESESPAAEETESAAAGEGTGDGGSEGDTGSGDDGGETEEDTGGGDGPKQGSGTVPNVLGMTTFAARDYLNEQGFTNIALNQGYFVGDAADVHCEIGIQTPQGGSTADYSSQIDLSYNYEDENNGGGTSCEW